jgi:Mrr restriction endonuclease-like protein
MRESVPKAKVIEAGFRVLGRRFGNVRRSISAQAARCMRAGEYDAVQRWMEVGKSVADFADRLDAFGQEWKRLVKATRIAAGKKGGARTVKFSSPRKKATPPSRFYEPAIKALAARGGEATSDQLAQDLEPSFSSELNEADLKTLPRRGVPRWWRTLDGARRDCIREGWIERCRDGIWKLTDEGKQMVMGRRGAPKG